MAQQVDPDKATTQGRDLGYAPDHILVKFRETVKPDRQANGAWLTGESSLDELMAQQQVQTSQHLLSTAPAEGKVDPSGLSQIYLMQLTQAAISGQPLKPLVPTPAWNGPSPTTWLFP